MKIIILLSMIYLHIFDDFHLQGILAKLKEYLYWVNHDRYNDMYKNDYKMALIVHGFSWAFLMQLPLLIYNWNKINDPWAISFAVAMILNAIIHAYVDDLKANQYKINLIQDQAVHFIQVLVTFGLFIANII